MDVAGERVGCTEALTEHTAEVEDEAQGEPRVRQPKPLEGRLRQDECLGLLKRDDVRRAREPVEEPDFAEQVTGLEQPNALRPVIAWHENLEGAVRDDEEAAIELTLVYGVLPCGVQPRLGVLQDDGEIGLVQVSEESAMRALAGRLAHSTRAAAPASITP